MKKKTLGRIALCAFALCLVSIGLLSGTLARYTSEYTGTGTVSVASWTSVSFNGGETIDSATFGFDLADTKVQNDLVNVSYVAPGDAGSFTIDLGPADVNYTYSIAITPVGSGIPVKFYDAEDSEITVANPLTGTVINSETNPDGATVTVDWEWVTATPDADLDYDGLNSNFTVTITARQILPTDTP